MTKALPSFSNRPILGYIHYVNQEPYFYGHNMHEEDGELVYDEIPVGIIPESCNAQLVYDENKEKTYVEVDGYIFDEYTKAKEIIERDKELSVSVELSIRELSYNAKDKYLDIEDFYFSGVTILGCDDDGNEVKPGMQGSNIKLADFSAENNSMFSKKLDSMQEKLDILLSRFDINNSKEGGDQSQMNKFEELLSQYGKTIEDIQFEYETMSDEELEAKFAELFGEEAESEKDSTAEGGQDEDSATETEDNSEVENTEDTDDNSEETSEDEPSEDESTTTVEMELSEEKFTKTFELSHDDIRCGLYSLLSSYEEADNDWYWISEVYDSHFVYEGWCTSKIYGQKYTKDGDNLSFDGERYELFRELLTESEKAELESMRANYSSIQEKLNKYELEEQRSDKKTVFENEDFANYLETNEFIELMKEETLDKFSKEELEEKANAALGKLVRTNKTFSRVEKKEFNKVPMRISTTSEVEEKPYGNLFD